MIAASVLKGLNVAKIDLIYQQAFAEALVLVSFSSCNLLENF